MKYKTLTLTQPWATLVAVGAKHIETRSWATSHRGPLAIHAAAGYGKGGMRGHKALCGEEPFCSVLNAACERHYAPYSGLKEIVEHPFMPLGAIVATCELVDVWPIVYDGEYQTEISDGEWSFSNWHTVSDQERAFGDYSPGRFVWLLADVKPLATPIPVRGALGLWTWDGAIE